jgi:antitoxin FitA
MPSVQIKDVPDDVHAELRRRADNAGKSLQEYLLGWLTEEARTPSLADMLARVSRRRGGRFSLQDAADAVRAERDAR